MGMYSRLDAVNHMLLMSGEHLANHLEDDAGVDTSVAEHILDETTISYVMRGVVNNSYYKKYIPDSSGYIYLPGNTLHAELAEPVLSSEKNQYVLATYRGSPPHLFNVTDNTGVWDAPAEGLNIMVVLNLDWEDIETPMQRAIMAASARDYQMITQGDRETDAYLAQREAIYTAKGRGADIHGKRRSLLMGSLDARDASIRNFNFRGSWGRWGI